MSSFGESDLIIDSTQVGRIRVLSAHTGSRLFPRLLLRVGVLLQRMPERAGASLEGYELRSLEGELRLNESGDAIVRAGTVGTVRPARHPADGFETQLELACDLDLTRLEIVERHRDGGVPRLWLALWPTVIGGGQVLSASIRPVQLLIPRDTWLEFLRGSSRNEYDVLELVYPASDSDAVNRASSHLREARLKLTDGDFSEAVALCRKVLEAIHTDTKSNPSDRDWANFFSSVAPGKLGEEYASVAARLKQIAGLAHHDYGSNVKFSRADALFMIRSTHAFLALALELRATTGRIATS